MAHLKIGNIEVYGIIYKITNKINGKIYIGQTIRGFDKRYQGDLKKYVKNIPLKRSIEKYGIENFDICKIYDIAFSKEELDIKEMNWVRIFNSNHKDFGYNLTEGGNGTRGYAPSEEQREKQRNKIKGKYCGKNNPNYHNYWTDEQKLHLSKIRKEKCLSKGKNNPRAVSVICLTTKRIFYTAIEASQFYKCDNSGIKKCCKGKQRYCGRLSNGTPLKWKILIWKHNKRYRIKGVENE